MYGIGTKTICKFPYTAYTAYITTTTSVFFSLPYNYRIFDDLIGVFLYMFQGFSNDTSL